MKLILLALDESMVELSAKELLSPPAACAELARVEMRVRPDPDLTNRRQRGDIGLGLVSAIAAALAPQLHIGGGSPASKIEGK